MKQILLSILTVLLPFPIYSRDFTYEYEGKILTYTVIDEDAKTCMTKEGGYDKNMSITHAVYKAGNYVGGDLVIPKNPIDNDIIYTLISLGDYAFYDCEFLNSVTIPDGVVTIGKAAFNLCKGLTTVNIPETVTNINMDAFNCCYCLEHVSIPNGVTAIYTDTFYNCYNLRDVVIPNTVSYIGMFAFSLCKALETVVIPENATVKDYAFSQSGIQSLTLSKGVTIEGENAFKECTKIRKIYSEEKTPLRTFRNLFPNIVYDKATLYVPVGSARAYGNTVPWSFFLNLIEYKFESGIDEVMNDAIDNGLSKSIDFSLTNKIFDLNGVRLDKTFDNLNPGVYIIRQGDKVKKILLK